MLEKTTPKWATECTDTCGLSRTGHYVCAFASFVVAVLFVLIATTTVLVLLNVPELIASFAIVFGFFTVWAGAWLATAATWNIWIVRRTNPDPTNRRAID